MILLSQSYLLKAFKLLRICQKTILFNSHIKFQDEVGRRKNSRLQNRPGGIAFCHPLASFRLPWDCFEPPKLLIASGSEISARSCQDLAEILPRTCREPSKNPPRTRRMNPKQSCLSHCDFFKWTAFSDKRFDKIAGNKSGAAVSPLGGLQLNK